MYTNLTLYHTIISDRKTPFFTPFTLFFFTDTATTEIYTLSLHDALPIYLQPTFSAPLMFFGGLLFGYGMVMSNGCGSRALVLLGRGNLRSFVVVMVLGIFAEMTLKGLIAPARIALLQVSQTAPTII